MGVCGVRVCLCWLFGCERERGARTQRRGHMNEHMMMIDSK